MEWTVCLWMHVSIKEVDLLTECNRFLTPHNFFFSFLCQMPFYIWPYVSWLNVQEMYSFGRYLF